MEAFFSVETPSFKMTLFVSSWHKSSQYNPLTSLVSTWDRLDFRWFFFGRNSSVYSMEISLGFCVVPTFFLKSSTFLTNTLGQWFKICGPYTCSGSIWNHMRKPISYGPFTGRQKPESQGWQSVLASSSWQSSALLRYVPHYVLCEHLLRDNKEVTFRSSLEIC